MNWKEAKENLRKYWFEMLTWVFIVVMVFFAYIHGTHHQNAVINAGSSACESIGRQVGLERRDTPFGTTWQIICVGGSE